MNKERLLLVAKALRESPHPERFTMDCYVHDDRNGEDWCGTPACALGHFAARTDLQDFLEIGTDRYGDPAVVYVDPSCLDKYGPPSADFPDTEILRYFGITEEESDMLFSAGGCGGAKTPEQAAQFIEWFVSKPDFL